MGTNQDVQFNGVNAGTNTPHFTGNATYQNGARFELSDDADVTNSINGKITIASGSGDNPGSIFTTDPSWTPAETDKGNASLFVVQTINFKGDQSGLIVGDITKPNLSTTAAGVYLGSNANAKFDFADFTNGQTVFAGDDSALQLISASDETVELDITGWSLGKGGTVNFGWKAGDSLDSLGFDVSGINGLLTFGITEDGLVTMSGQRFQKRDGRH